MKRHLLPLLLLAGIAALPAHRAQAQDKPVLNSAPPGPPPTPPRTPDPVPATTPTTTPAPVFAPEPTTTPAPQPTPDAPSGLNFPNRNKAGSEDNTDRTLTKKFIYTNFGLGYSSYDFLNRFNFSLAPALGFRLTDKFAVGPGISYAYNSFSIAGNRGYPYTPDGNLTVNGGTSLSTSSLGFKVFAQYIIYKEFFVHGEYEVTNAELAFEGPGNYLYKQKKTVTSPLAGVGYRSYFGEVAALDLTALYNFDNSIYSLYPGFNLRFSLLFNIGK